MQNKPQQYSLFPTRDSVEEVIEEAKAQLPITDENQLVALLQIHQNTLISLLKV
jgi:hypothetical protein